MWQDALDVIVESKLGSTQRRWRCAAKEKALDGIRHRVIVETQAGHLLACLKAGTVSTNVHLRMLHNFCLSMNWLPWPLIPKRQWPAVHFKEKRAITIEEHRLIIEREKKPERRDFYELCWHLGGSQSDLANLTAEDIDWPNQTIAYHRQKTGSLAMIHFGESVAAVLRRLPASGPLFPYLRSVRSGDRSTEFKQRCDGLGIKGVSLHSYRSAWAERAKMAGYPERFAQEALGHSSKAVHRAYARKALVKLPSLESYERQAPRCRTSESRCATMTQAVHRNSQHDDRARHHLLHPVRQAHLGAARANRRHDQGAHDAAEHGTFAARQTATPDHYRRDDVEFESHGYRWIAHGQSREL
jgi:integrase